MRHNLPAWEYFGGRFGKRNNDKKLGETMSNDNIIRAIHRKKTSLKIFFRDIL